MAPDILVVPECGQTEKIQSEIGIASPSGMLWVGADPRKGLGVYSFGAFSISPAAFYNPAHQYIFPVEVKGSEEFLLLAVWTLPVNGSYVCPLIHALNEYESMIQGRDVIIAGDFNANTVLPATSRNYRFRDFVRRAEDMWLTSLYHEFTREAHGNESSPTFFLYHHEQKPHHIDFLFGSANFRTRLEEIKVGSFQDWHKLSDHVPISAKFRR